MGTSNAEAVGCSLAIGDDQVDLLILSECFQGFLDGLDTRSSYYFSQKEYSYAHVPYSTEFLRSKARLVVLQCWKEACDDQESC